MSMKNSNDTIQNRTHDLLTCREVPQPTALPRAPHPILMEGQNSDCAMISIAVGWIKESWVNFFENGILLNEKQDKWVGGRM